MLLDFSDCAKTGISKLISRRLRPIRRFIQSAGVNQTLLGQNSKHAEFSLGLLLPVPLEGNHENVGSISGEEMPPGVELGEGA